MTEEKIIEQDLIQYLCSQLEIEKSLGKSQPPELVIHWLFAYLRLNLEQGLSRKDSLSFNQMFAKYNINREHSVRLFADLYLRFCNENLYSIPTEEKPKTRIEEYIKVLQSDLYFYGIYQAYLLAKSGEYPGSYIAYFQKQVEEYVQKHCNIPELSSINFIGLGIKNRKRLSKATCRNNIISAIEYISALLKLHCPASFASSTNETLQNARQVIKTLTVELQAEHPSIFKNSFHPDDFSERILKLMTAPKHTTELRNMFSHHQKKEKDYFVHLPRVGWLDFKILLSGDSYYTPKYEKTKSLSYPECVQRTWCVSGELSFDLFALKDPKTNSIAALSTKEKLQRSWLTSEFYRNCGVYSGINGSKPGTKFPIPPLDPSSLALHFASMPAVEKTSVASCTALIDYAMPQGEPSFVLKSLSLI